MPDQFEELMARAPGLRNDAGLASSAVAVEAVDSARAMATYRSSDTSSVALYRLLEREVEALEAALAA